MKSYLLSRATLLCLLAGSAVLIVACSKGTMGDKTFTLVGNASGSQETPSRSTAATASLNGKYNATTHTIEYDIDFNGLTAAAYVAHFHGPALAGIAGPPIVDLTIATKGVTGKLKGTAIIPDSMEAHLLAGRLYYNIHTTTYPTGEIRGQIRAAAD